MEKATKDAAIRKSLSSKHWHRGIDFFRFEHRKLERDLRTVVMDSLEAGIKQLSREFKTIEKRYDARLDVATAEEENWIIDDFIDLRADHEDQDRFLRNIALVALLSRLTHTLHQLAWHGESIAPRTATEYQGSNEFQKLWAEFRTRFGIEVTPRHIQWIEPLRKANLIIHNGGDAHPIKYERTQSGLFQAVRDKSFSKRHLHMVDGDDHASDVRITQIQLLRAVEEALALSAWLSKQLREKQLEAVVVD